MRNPIILAGYVFGTLMFLAGIAVLTGLLQLRNDESSPMLATVFGVVLLLLGIYRLVLTRVKHQREDRERRVTEERQDTSTN